MAPSIQQHEDLMRERRRREDDYNSAANVVAQLVMEGAASDVIRRAVQTYAEAMRRRSAHCIWCGSDHVDEAAHRACPERRASDAEHSLREPAPKVL